MSSETSRHPLDPLTPEEIVQSSNIFRNYYEREEDEWIFNSMILLEPKKKILLPFLRDGGDFSNISRNSIVVVIQRKTGFAYEAIVNLTYERVDRFSAIPENERPPITLNDIFLAEDIVRKNVEVRKLYKERGVSNPNDIRGDLWSNLFYYNKKDEKKYKGGRVLILFMYFLKKANENYYAHPVDFMTTVDLVTEKVISIEYLPIHDDSRVSSEVPNPLATRDNNFLPVFLSANNKNFYRKDVKPLEITQPNGPSFTLNGNEVSWQKWNFRISFDFHAGLVLHYITFHGREILYRVGLSEMLVSYGDPRPVYYRKTELDEGEFGLGLGSNTLSPDCDCIGAPRFIDFHYCDENGESMTLKNAVCIREEDSGLLHKHTNYRTNVGLVVRSRRLVVSFVVSAGVYDYEFSWNFYQDGTIQNEAKATGILSLNFVAQGSTPAKYGTIVFPLNNAQYHQHIFCVRLDTIIDGQKNSVVMNDVIPSEGEYESEDNPYGNGFSIKETLFKKPKESITDSNTDTSRFWTVQNPKKLNKYTNKPVAWKLEPMPFSGLLAGETGIISRRGSFARHTLWVTKYRDGELYAAGDYTNIRPGDYGLPVWASRDESIENEDVVLWHSFGLTHITQVEDSPIMPARTVSFIFKPHNFFDANPALDVPPTEKCLSMRQSEKSKNMIKDAIIDNL